MALTLKVNGKSRQVAATSDTPLLYVLRNDLELNAAKFGCGLAQCGSCMVLVDGKAVRSCLTPAGSVANAEIVTLEGLRTRDNLHPLQEAFIAEQAAQCGYCTAGMIMSAKALIDKNPHPTPEEIKRALGGNLCRCTGFKKIVEAIESTAKSKR